MGLPPYIDSLRTPFVHLFPLPPKRPQSIRCRSPFLHTITLAPCGQAQPVRPGARAPSSLGTRQPQPNSSGRQAAQVREGFLRGGSQGESLNDESRHPVTDMKSPAGPGLTEEDDDESQVNESQMKVTGGTFRQGSYINERSWWRHIPAPKNAPWTQQKLEATGQRFRSCPPR